VQRLRDIVRITRSPGRGAAPAAIDSSLRRIIVAAKNLSSFARSDRFSAFRRFVELSISQLSSCLLALIVFI
jgi:hypothetical protein